MEAETVTRSPGWVLGIEARIVPAQADYKELWERGFMPRYEEIRRLAVDDAFLGAYYASPEPGKVDFVAGMMTTETAEVPQGLVKRPVSGGLYARFQCAMSAIGPTWGTIYREWLPSSQYEEDETRPALECYPPETRGPDDVVTVFVALKPRR